MGKRIFSSFFSRYNRLLTAFNGFNVKAQIGDHFMCFGYAQAAGGEVPLHEYGVGRIKCQGLKGAQVFFAPAGHADFLCGIDKAEQAQGAQTVVRGQFRAV